MPSHLQATRCDSVRERWGCPGPQRREHCLGPAEPDRLPEARGGARWRERNWGRRLRLRGPHESKQGGDHVLVVREHEKCRAFFQGRGELGSVTQGRLRGLNFAW